MAGFAKCSTLHAEINGNDIGSQKNRRIQFLLSWAIRTQGRDVGPWLNPFGAKEGTPRRGGANDEPGGHRKLVCIRRGLHMEAEAACMF